MGRGHNRNLTKWVGDTIGIGKMDRDTIGIGQNGSGIL